MYAMESLCGSGSRPAMVTSQDVMGWKILNHEGLRKIHENMLKEFGRHGRASD